MDLCPECGHDYDLDGRWAEFCHYVKGSDPSLGFFRPVCNEGIEPVIDPKLRQLISEMSESLCSRLRQTLLEIECPNPAPNPF